MPDPVDAVDAVALCWFAALFLGPPLLGWAFVALDIRAYYRSLKRALVVVGRYALDTPLWALRTRPDCLVELGLAPGCTRDDVMAAYRRRVLEVHPDRGGDRRQFDRLQNHLQDALALVADGAKVAGDRPTRDTSLRPK